MSYNKQNLILSLLNQKLSLEQSLVETSEMLQENCHDENVPAELCNIINSTNEPMDVRNCAASSLAEYMTAMPRWSCISLEEQDEIRRKLMAVLSASGGAHYKTLVCEIVRCLACIMRHDASDKRTTFIVYVFDFLENLCESQDAIESHLGSLTFYYLAEMASSVFVRYVYRTHQIFMSGMKAAEAKLLLPPEIVYNLLSGWACIIPLTYNLLNDDPDLGRSVSMIVRTAYRCAYELEPECSDRALEMLRSIFELAPKMIDCKISFLLDIMLSLVDDALLDADLRIKALNFTNQLLMHKCKNGLSTEWTDRLINVLFRLFAVEAELDQDGDEDYLRETSEPTLYTTAIISVRMLANSMPCNELAKRSLRKFHPIVTKNINSVKRAAVFVFMTVLIEGQSVTLKEKHLTHLLEITGVGIIDTNDMVRRSAYFALCYISEHVLPDYTWMSEQVFVFFSKYIDSIQSCDVRSNARMFQSLRNFCESMSKQIICHNVPVLMIRLLPLMDPRRYSYSLSHQSLSLIMVIVKKMQIEFHVYFDQFMIHLMPLLSTPVNDRDKMLRVSALNVVNAMIMVDSRQLEPYATLLLDISLEIITLELEKRAYTLIGALSRIIPAELEPNMALIMNIVMSTLNDLNRSSQLAETEDLEEMTDERQEVILCLKAFLINMPSALEPYFVETISLVLASCRQNMDFVRRAASELLSEFVLSYWQVNDFENAKRLVYGILPHMLHHVLVTTTYDSAITVMNYLVKILNTMGSDALVCPSSADGVFMVLRTALGRRLKCQKLPSCKSMVDVDEHECDIESFMNKKLEIMQTACNLVSAFGKAMTPLEFRRYFKKLAVHYLPRLRTFEPTDQFTEKRSFIYGLLSRCVALVDSEANYYQEILDTTILVALQDSCRKVREHAVASLTCIIDQIEEHGEPVPMNITCALVNAVGSASQLCLPDKEVTAGLLSRLLYFNYEHMPLPLTLLNLFEMLPLKIRYEQYDYIIRALKLIYDNCPAVLDPWLQLCKKTIVFAIEKNHIRSPQTKNLGLEFIEQLDHEPNDVV